MILKKINYNKTYYFNYIDEIRKILKKYKNKLNSHIKYKIQNAYIYIYIQSERQMDQIDIDFIHFK